MKRNAVSLLETIVAPFMGYLSPQTENSFSSDSSNFKAETPDFSSEKLCLLIFIGALAFIAVISPVLCLCSLFAGLRLEGLWYFWLITFVETGYSVWLIGRTIGRKKRSHHHIAATKPCQFSSFDLYYERPINRTHHSVYSE